MTGRDYRRILGKAAMLLLPFFLYYVCYEQYLISTRQFSNDGLVIYRSIDKSKKKTVKKKVIFGDSVGAQLYPNDNDQKQNFYSLTTSAPSSLAGVYILLQNFVEHNDADGLEFYYVAHPGSLRENLRGEYTYNHFIKPFYTLANQNQIVESAHDSVRKSPYWYAAQLPFIKISDWQPEQKFNEKSVQPLSPVYVACFKKIDSLAKARHFKFYAVMPVLREDNRSRDYTELQGIIRENHFEDIFSKYFPDIKYLPINQFHPGSNHYLHPYELGDNPLNL